MAHAADTVRKSRKKALEQTVSVTSDLDLGTLRRGLRLLNFMNLDELLDASLLIEMGKRNEQLPAVKSKRAREYAAEVLWLNGFSNTEHMAEEMVQRLNHQIVVVNRKTSDAVKAKRLYRELMAEK